MRSRANFDWAANLSQIKIFIALYTATAHFAAVIDST
jgi:hypothetical protein